MEYVNLYKLLFIIYFLYFSHRAFVNYGPSNEKIKSFLIHLYCSIDEFLWNGHGTIQEEEHEEGKKEKEINEEKEGETKLKTKPKRFEDKYLEEYKKLADIELNEEKLERLKNNIIMENTPLGNVVMFYDNKKGTFVFYSDLTIPYRYLEVVGRKYVTTFNCKKLFIDMNEELKQAEEKKISKVEKNNDVVSHDKAQNIVSSTSNPVKKDVFAKFKDYNNNVTKEVVTAPSKNTGTNANAKKDNTNILLKENANRYRYEGKLANYKFLQQVDKKHIDKRLALSWSDYKALQIS